MICLVNLNRRLNVVKWRHSEPPFPPQEKEYTYVYIWHFLERRTHLENSDANRYQNCIQINRMVINKCTKPMLWNSFNRTMMEMHGRIEKNKVGIIVEGTHGIAIYEQRKTQCNCKKIQNLFIKCRWHRSINHTTSSEDAYVQSITRARQWSICSPRLWDSIMRQSTQSDLLQLFWTLSTPERCGKGTWAVEATHFQAPIEQNATWKYVFTPFSLTFL